MYIFICLPTVWLAANCNKLSSYNWSVRSMGIMEDIIENALEPIVNYDTLFLDEYFMMVFLLNYMINYLLSKNIGREYII